ncbi:hypothetical protein [Winogradskyella forsetii]|uniref:hypothetical protein n=1 Tax=Winogradskyella forsetii TaxID=2686077 RepID=UPI0015C1215D|nr:hypothetical protein [Winogradskyella forsetii]
MDIEISNVELSSRIFLKWNYTMTSNGRKTKIKASADAPIHEDLDDALSALVPHFVLVTEMKKKSEVAKVIDLKSLPEELLNKFRVTGVAIDDNKGDISYTITGYKILNTGRTVSFSSPKIRVSASDEEKYEFLDQLMAQIEVIKEEVLEYMDGKEALREQQSMDFGDDFNPEADGDQVPEEFEETAA